MELSQETDWIGSRQELLKKESLSMLCKEKEGSTVWLLLLLVLGAPLIKCKVKSEIPFKASFKFNQKMILSVASVIWKLTSVKLNGIMTKIGGGGAGGGRGNRRRSEGRGGGRGEGRYLIKITLRS
ncbi:hypothetical protein LIER_20603 [Lithospermum erythrorhizon]|uniref:Uncharacterized protein n=1 Tax=Lithospermum erythrorhizon TaxID=34254 RepID=A0AAV3QPF8_LITER